MLIDMNDDTVATLEEKKEKWFIPTAIILAGVVLSFSIYALRTKTVEKKIVQGDISQLAPLTLNDHRIGSPTAPVTLIEYADIDSPYAKKFQTTMEQLMKEYAPSGKVAWVYRHLPLIDKHPQSHKHAEASECVASLGGENLFWRFIDAAHAKAPDNQQLSPTSYNGIVSSLGVNIEAFTQCMNVRTFEKKVGNDFTNGLAVGAHGSPFSVLVLQGQKPVTIDGAVSYSDMKKIIDGAIVKVGI
jgi:protein-disulfide isomerase